MKKNSETGNNVNIANFEELYMRCAAMGATYKPSNEAISLEALAQLHANAERAQDGVNKALSDLKQKNNTRTAALQKVKPLATRVINALICSKVMSGLIDHMRSIMHLIRGTRVKPVAKPDPVTSDPNAKKKTRSVSQQSFDMMVAHIKKMIALLQVIPEYQPNEEDLKVTAIMALVDELIARDADASNSAIKLDDARNMRDTILYDLKNGLVERAATVKAYAKSIGEKEYRSVSSIRFRAKEAD